MFGARKNSKSTPSIVNAESVSLTNLFRGNNPLNTRIVVGVAVCVNNCFNIPITPVSLSTKVMFEMSKPRTW